MDKEKIKKYAAIAVLVVGAVYFSHLMNKSSENQEAERQKAISDSIRVDSILFANKKDAKVYLDSLKATKDSTWRDSLMKFYPNTEELANAEAFVKDEKARYAKEQKAKVKEMLSEYDKYETVTWYYNSIFKHYNNSNNVSLYVGCKDKQVWLCFRASYYGSDWIFFDSAKFSYGEETATLFFSHSDVERDNSGGYVWEWINIAAGDKDVLRAIAESPDASIRFAGKYVHEHKLTKREKSAMLQVLDGYEALEYLIQNEEDLENL